MNGDVPDTRYVNVCVEQHDFRPVLLNDMLALVKELNNS
jgi:hypothetical protein